MKKLSIAFIYIVSSILILTLLFTLFNYFSVINNNSIFKILIPLISFFIGGIYIGVNTKSKAFIQGIKLGLIFIGVMIILNIIFISNFEFKNILYYLILLITISLGSMIGINIKKSN